MTEIQKNKKIRNLIVIVGIAAVIMVVLYQSGTFSFGLIKAGKTAVPSPSEEGKTFKLSYMDIPVFYNAVGTVRSRDEIEFSPRIVARVKQVSRRSGDSVKKGELLIKLDQIDLEQIVARAKERVSGAQAVLALADSSYKRTKQLFDKNVTSLKQLEIDEKNQKSATSELAAAEHSLKEAQENLSFANIISPIDGIISERFADPGDLASPGKILMTIFDPQRLMLYVPVRESLVTSIKIGDSVDFHVAALNKSFRGDVREIVPSVDPGSRTFLVKICIDKANGLMPGMFGSLKLKTGSEKALLIPSAAVSYIGQLEYVTVLNDGKYERVPVRSVPAEQKDTLKIISGLNDGATILIPEKK